LPLWWELRSRGICRKLPHPVATTRWWKPRGRASQCSELPLWSGSGMRTWRSVGWRDRIRLPDACARLGADVARYSFIVVDLHHLVLAGLPAHLCENALRRPMLGIIFSLVPSPAGLPRSGHCGLDHTIRPLPAALNMLYSTSFRSVRTLSDSVHRVLRGPDISDGLRPCFSRRWSSRNSNRVEHSQHRLFLASLWTEALQSPLKLQRSCSMESCRATGSCCSRGETTVW
jgi:hypothetical protein